MNCFNGSGFTRPMPNKKSGSNIKSSQRGNLILASASTSTTVTISPVDLTKAIVRLCSYTGDAAGNSYVDDVDIVFTNSTTLTITRQNAGSGNSVIIYWEVIEFNNVKSIQSGAYTLSSSNGSVAVSSYSISKAILFISYSSGSNSSVGYDQLSYIPLDSTHISFYQASTIPKYIKWQLLEFN